uniref:Uncharacterized protein n=1 Tax=Varanus komodoensis TaxID=61221 RepID=A0A8D2KXH0_VARKO
LWPLKTLGLMAHGIQQNVMGQAGHKHGPDFHDKFGSVVLLGETMVSPWCYQGGNGVW